MGVVVPCYNYGRYLKQCVRSVLTQEGVNVNLVIIDDASTDDSEDIGKRLALEEPRVTYRRHRSNIGHIATYNEGLALISADYTVLLSADDLLPPGALLRATNIMVRNPSVGFVYGHPCAFHTETPPPPRVGRVTESIWMGHEWIAKMCRHGGNFIHSPEVVMRTSVQKSIGGYRSDLPHSGDMEMWLRAARVADVGRVNGSDQAYYRVHPKSMQRTINAGALQDLCGRRDAFRSALASTEKSDKALVDLLHVAERSVATATLRELLEGIDLGQVDHSATGRLLVFARETWPEIVATKKWRVVLKRLEHGPGPKATVSARIAWRQFRDKIAWRRWRHTGLR